jgi:hypothetical protein
MKDYEAGNSFSNYSKNQAATSVAATGKTCGVCKPQYLANEVLKDKVPYFDPANNYKAQHEGSEALAINNTHIRRFQARIAFHTTAKIFKGKGRCVPISMHKILKTGYSVHLTEARSTHIDSRS